MLSTFLNVSKKVLKAGFILTTSTITGAASAIAYLVFTGFKCLTNNMSANVSVDVNNVNYTQILDAIMNHNGTINLPISLQLIDTNIGQCTTPLKMGAMAGLAFGGSYLLTDYTNKCLSRKKKPEQVTERTPINRETYGSLQV